MANMAIAQAGFMFRSKDINNDVNTPITRENYDEKPHYAFGRAKVEEMLKKHNMTMREEDLNKETPTDSMPWQQKLDLENGNKHINHDDDGNDDDNWLSHKRTKSDDEARDKNAWMYEAEDADQATIDDDQKFTDDRLAILRDGTDAIESITKGYLEGLLHIDFGNQLSDCTGLVTDAKDEIIEAVTDFTYLGQSWGNWASKFVHVEDGFSKLVGLLPNMLTNLKQCGLAEDTMAVIKLVSLNMSITTVLARITSNALQNSFSLMGEMSMVTSAFNDARWYDFGHSR